MTDQSGDVHISPTVLRTVAAETTRAVPGVVGMRGDPSGGRVRGLVHWPNKGVRLRLQDGEALVDLYVILDADSSMLAVGREIQRRVAEAITAVVGMSVREVNVHVHDVR